MNVEDIQARAQSGAQQVTNPNDMFRDATPMMAASGQRLPQGNPWAGNISNTGAGAGGTGFTPSTPTGGTVITPDGKVDGQQVGTRIDEEDVEDDISKSKSSRGNVNKKKKNNGGGGWKVKLIAIGFVALCGVVLFLMIKSGGAVGNVQPTPEPLPDDSFNTDFNDPFAGLEDDWIINAFVYTEEERAALRRVGYTADDIDALQFDETPAEEAIALAEAERNKYLEETLKPYYDGRSEEFKQLEKDTWVGLEKIDESLYSLFTEVFPTNYSGTLNADYEKVTGYGHQLMIKVYLNDEKTDWVYYSPSPADWARLKSKGNVIAHYDMQEYSDDERILQLYTITSISIY